MQTEKDTKQQPFYQEWTLEQLKNARNGDTDYYSQGKNWGKHWGMTVGELIVQLSAYPPSQPIAIRRVVRADGDDDYDSCRDAMKKGEMDTMVMVALMCEGYSTTNLEPHELEEDYTEE